MSTAYNVKITYSEDGESLREKLLVIMASAAKKSTPVCKAR